MLLYQLFNLLVLTYAFPTTTTTTTNLTTTTTTTKSNSIDSNKIDTMNVANVDNTVNNDSFNDLFNISLHDLELQAKEDQKIKHALFTKFVNTKRYQRLLREAIKKAQTNDSLSNSKIMDVISNDANDIEMKELVKKLEKAQAIVDEVRSECAEAGFSVNEAYRGFYGAANE